MSLNNLQPAKGSNKTSGKRLGRGQGSGKGGTSDRFFGRFTLTSGIADVLGIFGELSEIILGALIFGFRLGFWGFLEVMCGVLNSGTEGIVCSKIVDLSGKFFIVPGGRGGSIGLSASCREMGSMEGGKAGFGGGGGIALTS